MLGKSVPKAPHLPLGLDFLQPYSKYLEMLGPKDSPGGTLLPLQQRYILQSPSTPSDTSFPESVLFLAVEFSKYSHKLAPNGILSASCPLQEALHVLRDLGGDALEGGPLPCGV